MAARSCMENAILREGRGSGIPGPYRAVVWSFSLRPFCKKAGKPFVIYESESSFSTAVNASLGRVTLPSWRIFFLPSFCFSSSFFLRVMSPP